jgi:hypothetical protein
MSAEDGSVTLQFGDGEYSFRLAYGQFRELQEIVNRWRISAGIPAVGALDLAQALQRGGAWPEDAREVIRLGLIGGGMKADRALVMVKRHVENKPFFPSMLLAQAILMTALVGPPADPVGKEPAPIEPETATEEPLSGSVPSTGSVLQ